MIADPVTNFAKISVSGLYDNTDTQITLNTDEGDKLPDPSVDGEYNLVWWNVTDYSDPADDPFKEIVRVTAKTDDVLTITRNQELSGAFNHNVTGRLYQMVLSFTKKMYDDFSDRISKFRTITNADSPYTALLSDRTILCDCTDGAITVILPAASTLSRKIYDIKKKDSTVNTVTINPNASETVDDGLTAIITVQYESITIHCDGSNWWIL